MCKHIHYLCMSKNHTDVSTHDIPDNALIIENNTESEIIVRELSNNQTLNLSHSEKQESLIKRYTEIIRTLSTPEHYEVMEKNLKSLMPKLNAVSQINSQTSFSPQQKHNSPANKNILPQRMFPAKKKRKICHTFEQNFPQDTQDVALSLILNHKNNLNSNPQNSP